MVDLVEWLRAQLDEDERIARAASAGPWSTRWNGQDHELVAPSRTHPIAEWTYTIVTQEPGASTQRTECDTADADHIARHDPARVLREVEAKRRLVALHARAHHQCVTEDGPTQWHAADPCTTLHLLASPYADRPGYREEWRP